MDIRQRVGLRIRELRKSMGLTQEALAFRADLDKTYVNEVENGKRNISIVNLEKLAFALDANIKSFFSATVFEGSPQ